VTERPPRKLAVLLHADVAGSTSLVQLNEGLAHDRIQDAFRRFSETIASHGGTAHEIRGDALVAEFARASDAVAASLCFQSANALHNDALPDDIRPVIRVGIAMGEVVVADSTMTGEGVVLAQRLEQLAEHGGICIQGSAYETIPRRFPFEYENLGEREVKGFAEPVRAYAVRLKAGAAIPVPDSAAPAKVVTPGLPDKPSIAVLPFTNMSGDAEQEYFSDGITEDIITELSRFRSLFVIARHSSFAYKGKSKDIRQVGRELGVRYVLEGSVRRAGGRVRITAQLIEADSGNHKWAERYDRSMEDVFAVQEEVSRTIAATLMGRVEQDRLELTRISHPDNLAAHDYLLRGKTHLYRYTDDNIQSALECFQKAIEISPEYAEAHAWLAQCHCWQFVGWWSENPHQSLETAVQLARRAVDMDPSIGQAHGSLAYALVYKREHDRALHHFERAIALVPCNAENTANYGWCMMYAGDPDGGLHWIERGERLNPLEDWWYAWLRGMAHYTAKRYEAALEAFDQVLNPPVEVEGWRAACYARAGDQVRAREAAQLLESRARSEFARYPGEDADGWRDYWWRTQPYRSDDDLERLVEGLRKAGLAL
jgi:TolB-like protein